MVQYERKQNLGDDSMKQGWLVVNHFLQTEKFTDLYSRLAEGARQVGMKLTLKTGCELLQTVEGEFLFSREALPDFVLFWDKDIRLATMLESRGVRLFNSAASIALCDDKSLTHLTLAGKVAMPKTILSPMTYPNVGYTDLSFVEKAAEVLGFPMVIKECFGSFGAQVYLVNNPEEAEEKVKQLAGVPFLMQEFISSSAGRDVRLQVVGERVVAAMLRQSHSGDFRANITAGGTMAPWTPTQQQEKLAISVCRLLGLDFAGVDFLFGEDEAPVLCEVNSNAHFKNLYDCTGVDVAVHIMAYIKEQLEDA